jgi:hypothetical protein
MSSTEMYSPSHPIGHYMYHQFNIHNSTFCPHSVFMCFVRIWEQTAIISLYKINWLVFRHVRKIAKSENYLSQVCPSDHLHGTTGRIYIKFNIHWYFENMSRKFNLHQNLTKITGNLREHHYTLMITSRLTFKNRASYIYRTGVPLPSKCCILYIFFNKYKYWVF